MISHNDILTRPLNLKELLAFSWFFYRKHFSLVFIIVFIVLAPIDLGRAYLETVFRNAQTGQDFIVYARVAQVLEVILGLLSTVAIAYCLDMEFKGKVVSAGKALISAMRLWPQAILVKVLVLLIVVCGTVLLIVPGIIAFVLLFFSVYALVLSEKRGIDALKYSRELVRGRWWKTAYCLALFYFLLVFCTILFALLFSLTGLSLGVFFLLNMGINVVYVFFQIASMALFINMDRNPDAPRIWSSQGLSLKENYRDI